MDNRNPYCCSTLNRRGLPDSLLKTGQFNIRHLKAARAMEPHHLLNRVACPQASCLASSHADCNDMSSISGFYEDMQQCTHQLARSVVFGSPDCWGRCTQCNQSCTLKHKPEWSAERQYRLQDSVRYESPPSCCESLMNFSPEHIECVPSALLAARTKFSFPFLLFNKHAVQHRLARGHAAQGSIFSRYAGLGCANSVQLLVRLQQAIL